MSMPALQPLSDEALMERIIQRDQQAFSILYDRYSGKLLSYFKRMLWNNHDLAEDCLQDLFMKIARQPELFDVSRSFRPWVYTVANNICKMEYRKNSTRGTKISLDKTAELADNHVKITEKIDRKDFIHKLKEVLQTINEPHRSTFMMRYFDELSLKEISAIFECSEGTVKSRLFYTLRKIATKLPQFKYA
jgi:RNA polymerase sigma-70 factor, ECF subfamily